MDSQETKLMEPNYVLKANEEALMPVNDSKAYYYLKKVLWIELRKHSHILNKAKRLQLN